MIPPDVLFRGHIKEALVHLESARDTLSNHASKGICREIEPFLHKAISTLEFLELNLHGRTLLEPK